MRKLLFIALVLAMTNVQAQQYRKFLFAVQFGLPDDQSFPIGSFAMEPGYRLHDRVQLGFRMEAQTIFSSYGGNNNPVSSMGINAHYYFFKRAFVGVGLGIFNPSNNFIMSNTDTYNQRNGIGFYPRVGWDLGHFRLMAEYNFVQPMKDYIFYPNAGMMGHYEMVNKNYLSVKIGFFIGGGRNKSK